MHPYVQCDKPPNQTQTNSAHHVQPFLLPSFSCSFPKGKIVFAPLLAGPERSAETLESAADAVRRHVRQRRLLPLGLLRGVVAHGGPPLLQHRKPHRAHERQELLRHIQIGQPFCVKLALDVRQSLFL